MLTLAACDSSSGPRAAHSGDGLPFARSSSADAISLTAPNVRATLTVDFSQTTSGGGAMYYNAFTGQTTSTLTVSAQTERYSLHSGTTADGALAFDLVALHAPKGYADDARAYRIRDGIVSVRDAEDKVLAGGAVALHAALGTQDGDPLSVMGGLVADALPAAGTTATRDGGTAEVTSVRALGTSGQTLVVVMTRSSEPGAAPGEQRRLYSQRNGKFVMDEMTTTLIEVEDGVETRQVMRMQYANVTWPQRQAETSIMRTTAGGGWGQHAGAASVCGTPEMPYCPPGTPGPDPGVPPDTTGPPPGGGGLPSCSGPATFDDGANLVYVHGIQADGNAWGSPLYNEQVRGKNRCDLRVAWDTAPTLGNRGLSQHTAQAAQLATMLRGASRNDLIFVGHSQGGLISRRVAHQFRSATRPPGETHPTVRGVVTTGTPHLGANIARSANAAGTFIKVTRRVQAGSYACRIHSGCAGVRNGALALASLLPVEVMTSDAMRDLRPGSSALQQVNAQNETFPRYGIQNRLGTRFPLYEVAGDALPGNQGVPVRQAAAAIIDVAYFAAIVSGAVAIVWPPAAAVTAVAAKTLFALTGASLAWAAVSYGWNASDGVVELHSQRYPNPDNDPNRNRESRNPSSHTAQIDGERSAADIQITLREALGVAPRLR